MVQTAGQFGQVKFLENPREYQDHPWGANECLQGRQLMAYSDKIQSCVLCFDMGRVYQFFERLMYFFTCYRSVLYLLNIKLLFRLTIEVLLGCFESNPNINVNTITDVPDWNKNMAMQICQERCLDWWVFHHQHSLHMVNYMFLHILFINSIYIWWVRLGQAGQVRLGWFRFNTKCIIPLMSYAEFSESHQNLVIPFCPTSHYIHRCSHDIDRVSVAPTGIILNILEKCRALSFHLKPFIIIFRISEDTDKLVKQRSGNFINRIQIDVGNVVLLYGNLMYISSLYVFYFNNLFSAITVLWRLSYFLFSNCFL